VRLGLLQNLTRDIETLIVRDVQDRLHEQLAHHITLGRSTTPRRGISKLKACFLQRSVRRTYSKHELCLWCVVSPREERVLYLAYPGLAHVLHAYFLVAEQSSQTDLRYEKF